uniref:Uncharacterized protein LOC104244140 n=1 Tax=Nicotiana sylvestris TaxID=4096 RepID=A0A1U7Y747_NICSY|nr:PREDICTED: uncharacterized protein LOC104244140 [Nicotiana sylvestris]
MEEVQARKDAESLQRHDENNRRMERLIGPRFIVARGSLVNQGESSVGCNLRSAASPFTPSSVSSVSSFTPASFSPTSVHMYSKNPKGYLLDRGVITLFSFLPGAKVVNQKTYHYSYEQKNMTEKLVQKILQASTVVPSSSPFASLVILIKKKDASWRIYVDYRQLNDIMVKNKYPIPVVEDLLDELHGANLFSKLDLRSAYRQIRMCEEDEFKTAFRTHHGLWQFWVMPFGLSNSLKTFQAIMHKNEEATQAFEALKQAMIQAPISALPDFTKHFVMEVYACGSGVGAV